MTQLSALLIKEGYGTYKDILSMNIHDLQVHQKIVVDRLNEENKVKGDFEMNKLKTIISAIRSVFGSK